MREVPLFAPRRDYSSIVGLVLWDATIAMEGTIKIQESLDVIRRITKGVTQVKEWGEPVVVTPEERATLTNALRRAALRGDIQVMNADSPRTFTFAASDASSLKVGYVVLGLEKPSSLPTRVYSAPAVGSHIFYKELQGATWAIIDLCCEYPNTTIVIAVDNSALFYVLRRGFTTTEEGRPNIHLIHEVLAQTGCDLLPVLIPGDQNVSDAPSRDLPLSLVRAQATWRALYAAAFGGSRHLMNFGGKSPRDFLERRVIEEAPEEILDELDAFDNRHADE